MSNPLMHAFDKIVPFLSDKMQDYGSAILIGERGRIPIKNDSFTNIEPKSDSKFIFIDGGNGEILKGPNVSVQFVRLYAVEYNNNVRTKTNIEESFVVVFARKKGLDVEFEAVVFDLSGNEIKKFLFDAFDPDLTIGGRRVTPSIVSCHVRRLLEIEFAIRKCESGILVRDGDLDEKGVEKAMKSLKRVAEEKGVEVVGLSKTSTLCTDAGNSALVALRRLAPKGAWVYDAGGSVVFVKLHSNSNYVFRCDVFDRDSIYNVVSCLASNSTDPAFLGYPYGLLDADKFAQVTKDELAQLKVRFAVQSKERFRSVQAALDAHDILDSL